MGRTTEGWARLPVGSREHRQDAVLALVLGVGLAVTTTLYGAVGVYGDDQAPWWTSALMIVANAAPIAFRRRWPMTVAVVSALAYAATQLLHVPEIVLINFTLFIALYTVGAWCSDRVRAEVVRWVIIGGMFAWVFVSLSFGWAVPSALPNDDDALIPPYVAYSLVNILINVLYFGGAWYAGNRAWAAAVAKQDLTERTAELASERERTAAQALTLERVRIARELHDVVAHHVSLMGVQAGARDAWSSAIRRRRPRRSRWSRTARAPRSRSSVACSGPCVRTTVAGRDRHGTEHDRHGTEHGRLGRMPELVEAVRTAGHDGEYVVVGDERTVPPTVGAVAFRIAQEAVTNVVKHAGPSARADVRLRYLDDAIEVEVADDGHGAGAVRDPSSSGLGHVGMRERVAAVGGRIEIGPRARGGYLVRAWLPTT